LDQKNELYEIIKKKVEAGEDSAIMMCPSDTDEGTVTTFFPREKRINFLLMGHRNRHPELPRWTDVSWYLAFLYNPLEESGVGVRRIDFSEIAG